MTAPGTYRAEQRVYAHRKVIGLIRFTVVGVLALDADGREIGNFLTAKAAANALSRINRGGSV